MNQLSMFDPKPTPEKTGNTSGAALGVKNAYLIYVPKGRAREYSSLACNTYRGCDHACEYCFGPSTTRKTTEEFHRPSVRGERDAFLRKVEKEARKYQADGIRDRVLLCFTYDPYQTFDVFHEITRSTIEILHRYGLPVQVLTKGGSRAMRDIDLFSPADAFASTLTFLDDKSSLQWEPGAALPADRIATLSAFHLAGIPTWVSLEPVLNPAAGLAIIRETAPFVDLFKVGKLNYHPLALEIDWKLWAQGAVATLQDLGYHEIDADDQLERGEKGFYVKHDLRPFLSTR